jgi:hypothetical protein
VLGMFCTILMTILLNSLMCSQKMFMKFQRNEANARRDYVLYVEVLESMYYFNGNSVKYERCRALEEMRNPHAV